MVWRDTRQDRRREQPDRGPQCVGRHSRALLAGRRANAVGRGVSRRFGCSVGTLDHDSRNHPHGNARVRGAEHRRYHRGTRQAAESMGLQTRLDQLRAERATIAESRSVATIDAELQRAQPGAATVWRATAGCRDVTLPESGQACATVLALRQALGTARRRDTLEADLRDAEAQLARLPAVTTADPQAETAANLVSWATFGLVKLAADDIRMARVTGMVLMPQTAGLVLMLATTLWQSGRPREAR